MQIFFRFPLFFLFAVLGLGCKATTDQEISKLEKELAEKYDAPKTQKLIGLYRYATKNEPNNPNNYDYLYRASDILWNKLKVASDPVAMLCEAVNRYGKDKNNTKAIELLTLIYKNYRYKNAGDLAEPKLIDGMEATLLANRNWIDTAVQVARLSMVDEEAKLVKPEKVQYFSDIVEGYAILVEKKDPIKSSALLFEAANANRAAGNFARAVQFYHTVANTSANEQEAANSQFMMAFVYENDLQALPQAKEAYEAFLKKYPKSEMAEAAQASLANLGKTAEELLEQFNKK